MQTEQFNQFNPVGTPPPVNTHPNNATTKNPIQGAEVSQVTTLRPQTAIVRDTPRYVVMAGDLMTDSVKDNFKAIQGTHLGGQWFSTTEIPCLWKFSGFVHRGRITPLIKKPVQAWQDESISKRKSTDIAEIRQPDGSMLSAGVESVYRPEYPYDSLQSILSERSPHFDNGFTEVTALEGIEWDIGTVQDIQQYFFKNWEALESGAERLPFLLREFEALIRGKRNETREPALVEVAEAFLESAGKFRAYAARIVTVSKNLADRSVNDRGYASEVSSYARFLAAQIEMDVEAPSIAKTISMMNTNQQQPAQVQPTGMSEKELELKERELNLREQELRFKMHELGMDKVTEPEIKEASEVTIVTGQIPSDKSDGL